MTKYVELDDGGIQIIEDEEYEDEDYDYEDQPTNSQSSYRPVNNYFSNTQIRTISIDESSLSKATKGEFWTITLIGSLLVSIFTGFVLFPAIVNALDGMGLDGIFDAIPYIVIISSLLGAIGYNIWMEQNKSVKYQGKDYIMSILVSLLTPFVLTAAIYLILFVIALAAVALIFAAMLGG